MIFPGFREHEDANLHLLFQIPAWKHWGKEKLLVYHLSVVVPEYAQTTRLYLVTVLKQTKVE